jgi:predicted secreted protein
MRKLGLMKHALMLSLACVTAPVACKTSPETAPPGASAPIATTSPLRGQATSVSDAAPPAANGPRTYPDSTTSISAAVGETFAVALPANVTVPMKWRLEPPPEPKLLAVGEEKYVEQPPADCAGCVGYGGTRLFAFTGAGAGKGTLHFALRPLSEPHGAAQKEVSIAFEIK